METSGDSEKATGAGGEQAGSREGRVRYKGGVDVKSKDIAQPPKQDPQDDERTGAADTGGRK